MDISSLQCFCEIYRYGNISIASKNNHISQQAMSKKLQALETELGVSLFMRKTGGVTPTLEGEELYQKAKPVLEEWNRFQESLSLSIRKINFGFPCYSFAEYGIFTVNDIMKYQTENNVHININYDSQYEAVDALLKGKLDIICATGPIHNPELETIVLYTGTLCLLTNVNNPLAQKDMLELKDLEDQTIIAATDMPSSEALIHDAISSMGIRYRPLRQNLQLQFGIATVRHGIASLFIDVERIPECEKDPLLKALRFRGNQLTYNIILAYKKGTMSSYKKQFLNYLIECSKTHIKK